MESSDAAAMSFAAPDLGVEVNEAKPGEPSVKVISDLLGFVSAKSERIEGTVSPRDLSRHY